MGLQFIVTLRPAKLCRNPSLSNTVLKLRYLINQFCPRGQPRRNRIAPAVLLLHHKKSLGLQETYGSYLFYGTNVSYGTHVSDFRLPMPERHDVVLGHTGLGGYGRRSGGLLLYASALAITLGDCVSPR